MSEVYEQRAKQLNEARGLLSDERSVASATALLSVHAAIALNDALLTRLIGRPFKGEDHREAVRETRKRCGERGIDTTGLRHLERLISSKSAVAYGDKLTSFEVAYTLSAHCEGFLGWAYKRLAEIQ